jgi:S-adenosylmethionine:tRNA ribosyltransferase-isomerase
MTDDAQTLRPPSPRMIEGNNSDMRTDDLDFDLPPELIAQTPPEIRSDARLLHYSRADETIHHRVFPDLIDLLRPTDLLVFNDARVIPARFALRKPTGGLIEGLFLSELIPGQWLVLLRDLGPAKKAAKKGTSLIFEADPNLRAIVIENRGHGEFLLEISEKSPALTILATLGRMPLPPYIKRDKLRDARDDLDRSRYQTVYAAEPGAVAAPTAGLHFTPDLLARLNARGIERAMVTLNVGIGTFKPITGETLQTHEMHEETYAISEPAAEGLNRAKRANRRIVAVGTTTARVLESHPAGQPFTPGPGRTSIFIYPPYTWKHVGGLVTNFHLPRSTLIALVAAMTDLEPQRRIYREAIARRYRFFSYGDAMFID